MLTTLGQLTKGERFRLWDNREGVILDSSAYGVTVKLENDITATEFITLEGEKVAFSKAKVRQWACGTQVEKIAVVEQPL